MKRNRSESASKLVISQDGPKALKPIKGLPPPLPLIPPPLENSSNNNDYKTREYYRERSKKLQQELNNSNALLKQEMEKNSNVVIKLKRCRVSVSKLKKSNLNKRLKLNKSREVNKNTKKRIQKTALRLDLLQEELRKKNLIIKELNAELKLKAPSTYVFHFNYF